MNLFTDDILYCINIHEEDSFNVFMLANHFRTENSYIFNCFTYECPIYRSFTELPMIFGLIEKIPFDKQTEANGNVYDNAFAEGYNAGIVPFIDTPQAKKELIHKTATKSFLGFYINETMFDTAYFEKVGLDAGKRYKAWEIICQTPDEFVDYFDKDNTPPTITPDTSTPQQITIPDNVLQALEQSGCITQNPLQWLKSKALLAYFVVGMCEKYKLKHGQNRIP